MMPPLSSSVWTERYRESDLAKDGGAQKETREQGEMWEMAGCVTESHEFPPPPPTGASAVTQVQGQATASVFTVSTSWIC